MNRRGFMHIAPSWDIFPEGRRAQFGEGKRLASTFFSEIPNKIKAFDVFELFDCIGDIVEVVIPPKKNKLDK